MRLHRPRRAMTKAVRSLSVRAKILATGTAVAALGGMSLGMAGAASAASTYTMPAQAGYAATGANFRFVSTTVKLPSTTFHQSNHMDVTVQLWGTARVETLQLVEKSGGWHADVSAYYTNHTLECSSSLGTMFQCGGQTPAGWNSTLFPAGKTMIIKIFFDRTHNFTNFYVENANGSNALTPLIAKNDNVSNTVNQVRVGSNFGGSDVGTTPWSSVTWNSAGNMAFAGLTGTILTTYSGHKAGLTSWWTTHQVVMSGNHAYPGSLSNGGANFKVYLH